MIHSNESKKLNEEEKALLTKCLKVLKQIDPSVEVILYGSRARGEGETDADYDLLILVDEEASLAKEEVLCRQLYPIELETGKILSAMLYSRQQWNTSLYRAMPFHENVERDGIIV